MQVDVYAEVVYPKALEVPPLLGHHVAATALSIFHLLMFLMPHGKDKKCYYPRFIIRTMKTRELKSVLSRSTADPKSLNPHHQQYCGKNQSSVPQEEPGSAFSVLLPGTQHKAPLGAAYTLLLEQESLDMFTCHYSYTRETFLRAAGCSQAWL